MKQKIGRSYIKCRLKWIAAVTGCGIVMTAVLFLNEVPAGEIAYGMLLCLGILLLAVTMDRISYGRRHRELLALRQSITVSLENLPEPGEILEEDYQRLLGLLAEEKMRIWNMAVSEKRDLMEYYTMWVHQIKTPIAALKLLIEEEADIPGAEEPLGADRERLQRQREKRKDEELQQPVRFKGLKVRDLLRLAAGKDAKYSELKGYLEEVGLHAEDYINRELNSSLSGGELKRIEIAMIRARGTKLSLFDEPEAGIDLWSFQNLIKVFEEMHTTNHGSIIIISHQERILDIADKIVVIKDGTIDKYGDKEDILPQLLEGTGSMVC